MAIAFDAESSGGVNVASWSHTVTGTNPGLVVFTEGDASDNTPSITYGGIGMNIVTKLAINADRWQYAFYLLNPKTGSNTVAVSGSTFTTGLALSYTGVFKIGVDNFVTNTAASGSSLSATLNVIDSNCWI